MRKNRSTKEVAKALKVREHLLREVAKGGYAKQCCVKLGQSWVWSGWNSAIKGCIDSYKSEHRAGRPALKRSKRNGKK